MKEEIYFDKNTGLSVRQRNRFLYNFGSLLGCYLKTTKLIHNLLVFIYRLGYMIQYSM